ncbi:HupE/UreJ family protein [Profundibacterium mesophilum]|uniref:HupE / UreJ proteindomain containing protein n=1 Tax=Profundibacterium mesophilum KAUST100406-0324 TaxID=1037889 RepID=A0A921NX52_9RHOB|nr:HupE/UreJ family protein [Profundibacterium mesophilum]KAF0676976.1 HupE / UreJ proteindomain containing protein [Profundibacterium mesophilum KAUST100406-0324]
MVSRLAAALFVIVMSAASPATAHEVQPAIGDLVLGPQELSLELEATVEPFIAGADLDGLLDTDASGQAAEVDRLRALPPAELEAAFRTFWPEMREEISILSGGQTVRPELVGITVPEVGDPSLPRLSRLTLRADLPSGDAPVQIGWDSRLGALVIRQMEAGPDAYTAYLTAGRSSDPISRSGPTVQSAGAVFLDYIVIGFQHIIPKGLDHILFVLGLFFLSARLGPLLWQVSAFTLAHTITLALGILGYVTVPAAIVEPLIAVSIVYVGVENILSRGLSPWRPVVVFVFGLLHGLGFASVLGEIGLAPAQFVTGLIGFNVGVEIGQLAVIAAAFLAVGLWFRNKDWYRPVIAVPASVFIALIGAYWAIERTFL